MLLTMCLFVSMDAIAKYLTQEFSQFQIVWARFFFHMLWLAVFLRHDLISAIASGNLKLQLLRSSLLMLTTLLFFSGLRTTELSTATVIMFLSPIFVTLLAIPLLGERVGVRRLLGVLIGFLGATIIMLPRGNADDLLIDTQVSDAASGAWLPETGHLLLICAAASNALYQIMTRRLRVVDSPTTTLFYSGVVGSVVMTLWVPVVWSTPDLSAWLLLTSVGLLGCVSHFCLIRAFRCAPASLIVPFSYSSLLWATLFGFVLFGSLPDRFTLLGAAMIIGGGLYIFFRERRVQSVMVDVD
jgi:drug/metabolite transporter (DMT)-like permease